ncbi:ion transporter [Humibacter soli]
MARSRDRARERATKPPRSELKNTAYEIFVGVLSILSIFNLVLIYVFDASPSLQQILWVMNALFSMIFLGDFLFRIFTAPSAAHYFFIGYGWADLFASLPFPQLKVLRVFRLIRVFRLMRQLGPGRIWATLIHDRANSALMTLLLMGILVLQFGSLWILRVEEHAKGANITTASDALWYVIVTISTVGYGDQYPVTNAGRIIGSFIIVVGVGIFGTFTGYLANLFLGPSKNAEKSDDTSAAAADPASDTTPDVTVENDSGAAHHPSTSPAAAPTAVISPDVAGGVTSAAEAPSDVAERLRALIEQSEAAAAELRRILADTTT